MKRIISTGAALAVAATMALPHNAAAQGSPPAPGTPPTATGVDCDFWGVGVANPFSPAYTRCLGAFEGNDKHYLDWLEAETGFAYLGSDDEFKGGAPAGWVNPIASIDEAGSGRIEFSAPLTGSYALALKSSRYFSVYIWEGSEALSGVDFIEFATHGVSGKDRDLSHASLFGVPVSVPEPGTLLLLGSGVIGLLGVGYQRKRSDV